MQPPHPLPQPLTIAPLVRIRKLYSLHYFQFATGYVFPGERHDFWELVYIDRGEADIGAGKEVFRLSSGQVIFHKPGEFHSIWANYASAPNIMVVTFSAAGAAMRFFRQFSCTLNLPLRRLLQQIIDEAALCFGHPLDVDGDLTLLPQAPPGSVQLIAGYLEQALLLLLRGDGQAEERPRAPLLAQEHMALDAIERASALMRSHLDGSLSFGEICRASGLGQTALKKAFALHSHSGVMSYYRALRLQEARRILRSGSCNITQTAEQLGYSSVHAFSRQFRQVMGMSPSEYLRSVRG